MSELIRHIPCIEKVVKRSALMKKRKFQTQPTQLGRNRDSAFEFEETKKKKVWRPAEGAKAPAKKKKGEQETTWAA